MIFLIDRTENTVGKGENAGHQHVLLFPECFLKTSSLGLLKVGIAWKRVNFVASKTNIIPVSSDFHPLERYKHRGKKTLKIRKFQP